MSKDARAEAMKQAIADADAEEAEEKKKKEHSRKEKGSGTEKMKETAGSIGSKISSAWGTKTGKAVICAAGGIFILLLVSFFVTGIIGSSVNKTPQYSFDINGGVLCVYESTAVSSGYAYDGYVEIRNTGDTNIYFKNMMFQLSDSTGREIMRDSNLSMVPAVIAPGETGYIYNKFGAEVTGITDPDMTISLRPAFETYVSEEAPAVYGVSDVQVFRGENGQSMTASVTNGTGSDASAIYVLALTYNASGYLTGISSTVIRNVGAGETVSVTFSALNMIRAWKYDTVTDYRVYGY